MPTPRTLAALSLCAATLGAAAHARANGAFPEAGLALVDPGDADHLVVRATYGVLTSRDAGRTWSWICEGAVGYANYDPMLGVTADGSMVAGLYEGLSATRDGGCAWGLVKGGWGAAHVVDLSVRRGAAHEVVLLTSTADLASSDAGAAARDRVWLSADDGRTFAQTAGELPEAFRALTIDAAPSAPARLYASGLVVDPPKPMAGAVARSTDGGATWDVTTIEGLGATTAPYLAAVDPLDPGVLYVRSAGVPGRLFVSRDGGATFTQAWQAAGFMKAFALSPDGATVVAGGPSGLFRGPTATMQLAKVSSLGASCLSWARRGLYVCGSEKYAGFELGLSTDGGETFAPVMHLPCVRGPLACAEGTSVATTCAVAWPAVAAQIKQPTCGRDAGAEGDAGAGGAGGGGAPSGDGGVGGAARVAGAAPAEPSTSGCGCAVVRGGDTAAGLARAAAFVAAALALRRRRAPRGRPCGARGPWRSCGK